jgi:hypothetical protein
MLLHYGPMASSPTNNQPAFKLPGACDTPLAALASSSSGTASAAHSAGHGTPPGSHVPPQSATAHQVADVTAEINALRAGGKGKRHGLENGSHWDAYNTEALAAAKHRRALANWAIARRAIRHAFRTSSGFVTLRDMGGSDIKVRRPLGAHGCQAMRARLGIGVCASCVFAMNLHCMLELHVETHMASMTHVYGFWWEGGAATGKSSTGEDACVKKHAAACSSPSTCAPGTRCLPWPRTSLGTSKAASTCHYPCRHARAATACVRRAGGCGPGQALRTVRCLSTARAPRGPGQRKQCSHRIMGATQIAPQGRLPHADGCPAAPTPHPPA